MGRCLFIDFETLGNAEADPNVAVPSMAVCVFDPTENIGYTELVERCLFLKFNWTNQIANGRTTHPDTIEFWKGLPKEAFDRNITPNANIDIELCDMYNEINLYFQRLNFDPHTELTGSNYVYTRGNAFDVPLMTNILNQFGYSPLYPFWQVRDIRTEIDTVTNLWDANHAGRGYVSEYVWDDSAIKHHPSHDLAIDIKQMQYTYQRLFAYMDTLRGVGGA